jgi:hypothetical protein
LKKILLLIALVGICVLCAAATARAQDIYIEEELDSSAPAGQGPIHGLVKTWIKGEKMRKNNLGRDTVIFRPDKGVAWMIHEPSKTYAEIPIAQLRALTEQSLSIYSPSKDSTSGAPASWFKKTGRTKKIGKWNCFEIEVLSRQVVAPGIVSKTTQWISRDTGLDAKTTERIFRITLGGQIPAESQKLLESLKSLDGYTVENSTTTEGQGQNINSTLTLKKVEKKTIDDSMFEIPFGFTKMTPPGSGGF